MMNHTKPIVSLALVGLLVFAATTNAADASIERRGAVNASVEQSGVADEVRNCVAAVREHLDYSDAARVRHDVIAIERRTVGYTLKIRTMLFDATDDLAIRAYSATCIVNGNNAPLSFEIREGL